jgi:peptidoglycan/xylan/chitin deacetylase (PgdA/CDA1 family)
MLAAINFHYVRDTFEFPYKAIHGLLPREFKAQIEALSKEGQFVSQDQIIDGLAGKSELPQNSILITFDDGLREQVEVANPILNEMGVPSIFFINPINIAEEKISNVHQVHLLRSFLTSREILEAIKKNGETIVPSPQENKLAMDHYFYDHHEDAILKYILNFKIEPKSRDRIINGLFENIFSTEEISDFHSQLYMTSEMLRNLDSKGALGSHTYSHQPLGLLDSESLFKEFAKSEEFFKSLAIHPPKAISYPYGSRESCSKEVIDLAGKFGFSFGFTMERAGNPGIIEKPLQLARFDCNDVVGGKSSYFSQSKMFDQMNESSWA